MANREYLLSVKDESDNSVRSIYVSINDTGQQVTVRQDNRYDDGAALNLTGIAVNLYNVSPSPARTVYSAGATWADLVGDGKIFNITTNEEIRLDVCAQRSGQPLTRTTAVPPSTLQPVTIQASDVAGSFEIAEDGWLRPLGNQVSDWHLDLRDLEVPHTGYQGRYTNRDEVRVILRAPTNQSAGFYSNFGDRLDTVIEAAEMKIDSYCGRTFGDAAASTKLYVAEGSSALKIDDFVVPDPANHNVVITIGQNTINSDNYIFGGTNSMVRNNIYNMIYPVSYWLYKGAQVTVRADYGYPVPADVKSYAGKLAADMLRYDAMRAGMMESGDNMAYAKMPGKDIQYFLGRYRTFRGM